MTAIEMWPLIFTFPETWWKVKPPSNNATMSSTSLLAGLRDVRVYFLAHTSCTYGQNNSPHWYAQCGRDASIRSAGGE